MVKNQSQRRMKMKKMLNEWKKFVNEAWDTRDFDELPEEEKVGMLEKAKRLIDEKPELADEVYKSKDGNFSKPLMRGFEADYIKSLGLASGGVVQLAKAIITIKQGDGAASSFDDRKGQIVKIHDGFVDFLEVEDVFPMGEIPKSVMDALMNAAMVAADAMGGDTQE